MHDAEVNVMTPFLEYVASHPRTRLIGKDHTTDRAPTIAFTVDGMSSMAICDALAEQGIGVGAGNFYAYRLIEALGIDVDDGVVRASMVHYTHPDEVAGLISALDSLIS